jgi:aspartyl/asparaginyl beta-hydroxylase (cupin superfamily)
MNSAATMASAERPIRSRAFVESWADRHGVPRSGVQRVLAAVDRWGPGAPLIVPDLDQRAFYDSRSFPWIDQLTRMTSSLRRELSTLSDSLTTHPESTTLVEQGGWQTYFLWRSGRHLAANSAAGPAAAAAAELGPGGGQAGNAYYSVIQPATRLRRHTGPFNGRLRCHLGLDVPGEECQIEIAGEYRSWRNDECLVFSDLPPHSVANSSLRSRAVYVLDFWHPGLTPDEQNALAGLIAGLH